METGIRNGQLDLHALSFGFVSELKNTIETQMNELKTQLESKCSLQ